MAYIHQLSRWPEFSWDAEALADSLAAVRYKQGRHLGRMESLGFELQVEANLISLADEVVKSSAIEGERLDPDEVRSSIARQLGLDAAIPPKPWRHIDGIVEMMLDATRNFEAPLSGERLFGWHAALFPTGRSGMQRIAVGGWRDDAAGPMRVISGPIGKERIHLQAPEASRLDGEMALFIDWYNRGGKLDPVLKAAVAHLWFVTVHPFDDGNGRIARAIADMALARADGVKERFYSMSAQIEAERKEYYIQLESAQRGSLDITAWLAWFLGCLGRSIDAAGTMLGAVLYKAQVWRRINEKPINERQRMVINRMLEHEWRGYVTTSKYARLAKCSGDTALRDIHELVDRGILVRNEGSGRSTSYRLADPDANVSSAMPGMGK